MNAIEQIKAEIERLKKMYNINAIGIDRIEVVADLDNLLSFIDTLQPSCPQASDSLEKAAEEYAYTNWRSEDYHEGASEGIPFDPIGYTEKIFKAGANWQKNSEARTFKAAMEAELKNLEDPNYQGPTDEREKAYCLWRIQRNNVTEEEIWKAACEWQKEQFFSDTDLLIDIAHTKGVEYQKQETIKALKEIRDSYAIYRAAGASQVAFAAQTRTALIDGIIKLLEGTRKEDIQELNIQ